MYKAKVEAVNGTKVLAGGKWLTCIGNKPVKVGDRIWTDGRCVYGNYQTPQSPIVITPNYEGIPILVENHKGFTFIENKLKYIESIDQAVKKMANTKKRAFKINSTYAAFNFDLNEGVFFISSTPQLATYLLEYFLEYGVYSEHFGEPYYECFGAAHLTEDKWYVSIFQNDKEIFNVDIAKIANEEFDKFYDPSSKTYNYDGIDTVYEYHSFLDVRGTNWAFIENNNNWAFIITVSCSFDNQGSLDYLSYRYVSAYYFDSTKKKERIFHSVIRYFLEGGRSIDNGDGTAGYIPPRLERDVTNDFDNAKKIIFPIQDGYYFKMTDFFYLTGWGGIPECAEYEIYSPKNKLIYKGWFKTCAYIAIYKLQESRYLLGVSTADQGLKNSYYPLFDLTREENEKKDKESMPEIIQSGVYICKNGILTKIDEEFKTSGFLNYFLRPMKNSKNWWNKIQHLT